MSKQTFEWYLLMKDFISTWACETDHKPLVSIINKKNLSDCPLRIQRLLLRLQKYDIRLMYTPRKFMYTSVALSCAYLKKSQPLMQHTIASYPWEKIGVDLCVFEKENYLIIYDYYSNFPEVCKLQSTASDSVIKAMKYVFSNLGICKECFSDNGPQFSSKEFREFVNEYQFKHTTSSPKYPQSNGLIESNVKIVKNILKSQNLMEVIST